MSSGLSLVVLVMTKPSVQPALITRQSYKGGLEAFCVTFPSLDNGKVTGNVTFKDKTDGRAVLICTPLPPAECYAVDTNGQSLTGKLDLLRPECGLLAIQLIQTQAFSTQSCAQMRANEDSGISAQPFKWGVLTSFCQALFREALAALILEWSQGFGLCALSVCTICCM